MLLLLSNPDSSSWEMTAEADIIYIDSVSRMRTTDLEGTGEISITGEAYAFVYIVAEAEGDLSITGEAYVNVTVMMAGAAYLPRISTTAADSGVKSMAGATYIPLITSTAMLAIEVEATVDSADCIWIGSRGAMRTYGTDTVQRYTHRTVAADAERVESEETPSILRYARAG